jgi:flagellin
MTGPTTRVNADRRRDKEIAKARPGEPPSISATLNLNGLNSTNLASSLLSQLGGPGGNFTVNYDASSGALSIGISSTGAAAGMVSIGSSANSVQETIPDNIFTSDGTATGSQTLNVTVGILSSASVGTTTPGAGQDLSATDLNSAANAATALTKIALAINDISNQRGAVRANINRLTATVNNAGTEQINLQGAVNNIQNADIGKTVANMTQYNILQATGMAALQQANQAQQAVLKLVQ